MLIVLGATGHIGYHLIGKLSASGHAVLAVVHDTEKAKSLDGVEVAAVDVRDVEALRSLFQRGKRAFLLNPPADIASDTNKAELETARSITDALTDSGLEKIVLASTYGAQQGDAIGDLSVLFEFERLAAASGTPMAVNRGAYYFSNLDVLLESARDGVLATALPPTLKMPMVAPADLANAAAARLTSPIEDVGIEHVEGPERYTFEDVANAFSQALGHDVRLETIPREAWEESFRTVGFSRHAARSYARMTAAIIDNGFEEAGTAHRGATSLQSYVDGLVRDAPK